MNAHEPAKRLAGGVSAVMLVRAAGLILSFGLSIILGRCLGAAGLGTYTFILSWVGVLGMTGVFGLDRLLVREVACYASRSAWGELRGFLRWALAVTAGGALLVAAIVFFTPPHWLFPAGSRTLLPVAMMLVLTYPFFILQQGVLSGLGKVVEGQFLEGVLLPLSILVILASAYAMTPRITLMHAVCGHLAALGGALALALWRSGRALPQEVRSALPSGERRRWSISAGQMFLLGVLHLVGQRIDVLMLGKLSGAEELGMYAAAMRGANLISLPFNMAVIALVPVIARLHAGGELAAMQHQITRLVRWMLLAGVVVAVALNTGSRWFFGLYGDGFAGGAAALAILSIGQLVNVAAGPAASLLTMTRHERSAVTGIFLGTLVTLVLGAALIARWGANGAAVASSLGLITWNLFLAWTVRRRLGISPMALR